MCFCRGLFFALRKSAVSVCILPYSKFACASVSFFFVVDIFGTVIVDCITQQRTGFLDSNCTLRTKSSRGAGDGAAPVAGQATALPRRRGLRGGRAAKRAAARDLVSADPEELLAELERSSY